MTMRNTEYLDAEQPEDKFISDLMEDEEGNQYRLVYGDKIAQIKEETQHDIDMNRIINRDRVHRNISQ